MADAPLMFPSPKQSFLADEKQCRRHMDLLADENLQRSIATAMSQQEWLLCHADAQDPSARYFMMRGAIHFLEIFHNLALATPHTTTRIKSAELNHGA